jgi:hypothetical protein
MGIEGLDEAKPGAQPADESHLQTDKPDQPVDTPVTPGEAPTDPAPDADEPGDTELDPELADVKTDDSNVADQVDQEPSDG